MIKKVRIDELEKGMYVSGFQKDRSDKALFFMNNLLIKTDEELREFYDYGYRSAYVLVNDPAGSEDGPPVSAEAGYESPDNPGGLKTNLKGIEEYEPANHQPADQRDGTEGDREPGPVKVGLEPPDTEAAQPDVEAAPHDATDIEAAPPGIETAFPGITGATGIAAADPGTTDIENTSTSAEAAGSDIEAADPRTTGTEAAPPGTTDTIDAEAAQAGAEPADPRTTGTIDAEGAQADAEPASPRTTGATDAEGAQATAEPAPPRATGATDAESAEPDVGAAPPRATGATDTESAETDVGTANHRATENSPPPSVQESSPAQSSREEPPARHIRLIDNPEKSTPERPQRVEVADDLVEYRAEIEEATKVRDDAEVLVREFMHDKQGELKPERVHQAVEQMVDSVFRNRDALSSLVRLKSADDYTFAHCVNVCILSVAVSRQMGFAKETAHDLGVGAILHDIGKTCITEETLKKPGPLSAIELDEVRTHPALGQELLLDADGIKDESKYVVVQHHEKYNGTGYPNRKEGERIHVFARIAAVADVYDAMTSTRVYQKALPPDLVLQKMYMWRNLHFEPALVERLIKCLGIYPIGTLVELNTGEIAVVTATNPNNPIKPAILVLFDEDKVRIPKPIDVNLHSEMTRWVIESKDPGKFGIDIEDIIA